MIVIARALTISPIDDEPLTHPIIGWQNIATEVNLSADSAEDDNPVTNLLNPATNLIWRAATASPAGEEHLTIDLSNYLEEVDYIAVARHNFGSGGFTCSVEYLDTEDSPDGWVELVEEVLLADDKPVVFRFTPAVYAGVRLRLQSSGETPPEAAVLYVGKLLVFEQGVQGDYTPLPFGRVATVVSGVAEAGDFLGRIITSSRSESQASFANLTPAWMRERLDPFLEVSAEQPFFFSWSPEAFPTEVGFAWLENNAQPAFNIDGYGSVQFNMTGILA
jgi:hypothetical protein